MHTKIKVWSKVAVICIAVLVASDVAVAGKFRAYYTKIDSGEAFEKYSRTGPYADIAVELRDGKFVFWRGSSYLPYWETQKGKTFVEEMIPRSGDGPRQRPDIVNTYSRTFLVESTEEKAVVWWRYLPQFGGKNPHTGVDATKFVDEYFTITADGKVTRTIRQGTAKIDDWRDPANKTVQTFRLTGEGITEKKTQRPSLSGKAKAARGAPVKTRSVESPAAWWKFDEAKGDIAVESVSGERCTIEGHKSLWKKGVSGTALQFDGYNSLITLSASKAPKVSSAITLEGWVAIGAYPWSWAPIVQQADDVPEVLEKMTGPRAWLTGEEEREDMEEPSDDFKFVLKKEDDVGYFLGIDGLGYPGLKIKVGAKWEELVSDKHLERRRWYQVTGTYDKETGKMKLYVDGKPTGEKTVAKANIVMSGKDIRIGKGKPRRPTKPVRANTFIDSYSFDGLIDEVRIYDTALSAAQIAQSYKNFKPAESLAEMDKRVLPAGKGTGQFGAYYAHLKFYETWDNLWRFSEHPDVVVEFEELPTKFVFWRGVGYIPMMVNENGQWYSNEFNETWNRSGGQGCQEPMSDKESYTNHVRIIENTPARVVVHWRYPLVDVLHVIANYHEDTGWGDWSDWYYYIYPDGVSVKTMHLWTDGERDHEWQEGMAILGPDQHPEQVLETRPALMVADLKGNVERYNWVDGPPDDVDYDNKKIHVVNYKAEYDPYTIGDFRGGNVYGGEVTDYAVFPSWNHWPVGQMPSDGRYASFPDRTAHSSLTHVWLPTYKEDFGDRPYEQKIMMEGMSDKSPEELVPLAKSWLRPAKLEVKAGGMSEGYDRAQRAYVLAAAGPEISVVVKASEKRPMINPAFVIKNWGEAGAVLTVDGEKIKCGKSFRYGHRKTAEGSDLIVWIKKESTRPLEVSLLSEGK
ncbi:MAG: LamG domain-containing protein [Planctomycetota bacterium]|nr:MAG: LamG domain-containing protein [Planctomycetota bacterium]